MLQIQTFAAVILTVILVAVAVEKRDGDGDEEGSYTPSCHDCFYCYCHHRHCPSSSKMSSLRGYCQHQGHVNCSKHYDVDGGWSQWQAWGDCTGSCTHGSRTRRRLCSNPEPANCGSHCHGYYHQTDTKCKPAHCYTTATTSITTSTTVTTTTTTQSPPFISCSKLCSVSAVVNKHPVLHKNATSCPGNSAGSSEALPLHCCGGLDLQNSHQGIKVMQNCTTFPKYTVVAVVKSAGIDWNTVGIFVGCLPGPELGFQLIRQDCTQPPTLVHVNTTVPIYGSPYAYTAVY